MRNQNQQSRNARSATASLLREGLRQLRDQKPPTAAFLKALTRVARSVCARSDARGGLQLEDLPGTLVLHLLEGCRRHGPRALDQLLALEDRPLQAAIRTQMVRSLVESVPRWEHVRALRAHVREALKNPAAAPGRMPATIQTGKRFCAERIAEAVAFLLAQRFEAASPLLHRASVASLADELLAAFPVVACTVQHDDAMGDRAGRLDQEDEAGRNLDARAAAEHVVRTLAPADVRFLADRLGGSSLEKAGAELGISLATAHRRERAILAELRRIVGEYQLCQASGEAMVDELLSLTLTDDESRTLLAA